MPILDNELIDNVHTAPTLPKLEVASAALTPLDTRVNMGGFDSGGPGSSAPAYGGMSISELSKLGSEGGRPTFDSPFQMIPKGELLQNKRYALYERGKDMENIYGLHQSAGAQLGNGLLKMGAVAVGTFAQGFATIPDTISAIKNGSLAELSGQNNSMETGIDTWLKNIEDELPNYITRKEQEHPFLAAIPGFAGSANFWGNSIIKNIGFTVGAIGSALAQDAIIGAMTGGIGEIPLISGQVGKAAIYLNKILSGTNDLKAVLGEINAGEKTAMTLMNLQRLAAAERVTTAARYGLNLYGSSRTEAAIEARDGYRAVHDALTEQHRLNGIGKELTAEESAEIDDYATNAMNTRFGINMALLTVSNAVQFDNILKPFSKGAAGSLSIEGAGKLGLVEGSLDTFEKKAATTIRDKAWQAIKPKIATVFSEGMYEEGGQFAAEKGVTDYYTRKYKKLSDPKNKASWNWLNESMTSTTEGLSKQFNSTEGIQNMMIGALSAVITGQGQSMIQNRKGPSKEQRLQSSINILNNFGLTGIMSDKYNNTLDSVGIAKDMTHAAQTGNLNHYKNFQHDMFFNFVSSRIPSGMHESTMEQLQMLKELDPGQFQKMFGMDSTGANQKTAAAYVDKLVDSANKIKANYDALDRTFKNPFKFNNDPKTEEEVLENKNYSTFSGWKTELAYQSSIADNSKYRLESIEKEVMAISPSLSNDLVGRLSDPQALVELASEYEDQANTLSKTITEFTSLADKRRIKDQIKALRTRSENIHLAKSERGFTSKEFIDTVNFELNGRDATKEKVVPLQLQNDLFKLGMGINEINNNRKRANALLESLLEESGYKDYSDSVDREDSAIVDATVDTENVEPLVDKPTSFVNHKGLNEDIEVGREYEIPKFTKPSYKKLADDRYVVTDHMGNKTFYKDKQTMSDAIIDKELDRREIAKVKVLAINEDGTVKVEDISGNIQNISYDELKGYRGIETEQEKLIKNAAKFAAEQTKLELKSGTENINTPTELTTPIFEEKLRDASFLFTGSISPSEASNDAGNKLPHVIRARTFLNNVDSFDNRSKLRAILMTAKQIEALGLSGLIQMSFDKPGSALNDLGPINDPVLGFVAQVFVVQENGKLHYSDKEGKSLGEVKQGTKIDINEVVFQTMPTATLTYANGDPKYRDKQKDQAEGYLVSYTKFRQDLFATEATTVKANTFIVSRGHAKTKKINGISEKNNVGGILVPEDLIGTQEGLIVLPTLGVITDSFGAALNFPKGTPVLKFGSTIEFLNNRKFTNKEANTAAQVIALFSKNAVEQSKSGQAIELVNDYSTYLQNVLYWRQDGTNSGNQIHIDPVTMQIGIGNKKFPMVDMDSHVTEITELLQDAFIAINNKSLLAPLSEPFYEFVQGGGNIVTEDDYVIWDNYQSYLLSATDPLGKARPAGTVPLSTKVAAPTLDIPYSFEQKYSVLQGMELKISVVPKVIETPKPAPQKPASVGTTGAFKTSEGDVNYTIEGDSVKIVPGEAVTALANKQASVDSAKSFLNKLGVNTTDVENAEVIKQFIAKLVEAQLQREKESVQTTTVEDVAKDTVPTQGETIGDYTFGDDVVNHYKTGLGVLEYTATRNGNDVTVELLHNDALTAQLNSPNTLAIAKATSKESIDDNDTVAVHELVKRFLVSKLAYEIEAALKKGNVVVADQVEDTLLTPTISKVDDGDLYEFKTDKGIIAGVMLSPTEFRIDGISANTVGKGDGSIMFESLIDYLKNKGVTTITTASAGDGAKQMHNKAVDKGLLTKVKEDGRSATFNIVTEATTVKPIEATVISTPVVPTGVNRFAGLGGKKTNLPNYRAVGGKLAKYMNEKELEIFKAWHEKNTPNIPFEVLDRLVTMHDGNKAWGVFEDGVAKFVKGALRGTEYHEIFEGIYKGMLSDEEQESLLEEFKSKAGTFTDRVSGRKISYNEATDLQAKERIADDFADFRQGKLPSRSLGEMVKNFFNRIINFVKSFIGKKNLKDSLFSAIEKGAFKERTLRTDMDNSREYAAVEGLREVDTHEFIQDMTARAAGILYAEGRKGALFTPDAITTAQMFATIEQQYMNEYYENGFSKREMLGDQAWKELQIRTLESLGYLGLRASQADKDNINSEGANKNDYVSETFTTDWKSYSTGAIKFSLATLLETVNNNQEGELSLVMPSPAESNVLGFKLMNFSRTFATVLDKLCNTSKTSLVVDKLSELAGEDSNYVRLFQRAGGNLSNRQMEFKDFDKDDWRYFIQFNATFTKQKPDALIQYVSGNEVFTAPANLFTAAKQKQASWIENIKIIAEAGDGIIKKNKATKTYQIDTTAILDAPTKTPTEMVALLNSIGVDFTIGTYNKLKAKGTTRKTNEQVRFAEAVQAIKLYLGTHENIMSVSGKTLGINSQLSTLSNLTVQVMNPSQESTFYGVDGQQIGSFADNNAPSLLENEFNESATLDDLLLRRPELNDIFSANSQVLKKGGLYFDKNGKRIKDLKVGYIQGTKDVDTGKGRSTGSMTIGDRFTQEINQNLNGNYYILIPADGSTEWMMNLGNVVSYSDVQGSRGTKKINDIFKGYLKDDIALALDSKNREHIKALKGKGADLRFFKEILFPAELKAINNLIAKGATQETIEEYINGSEVSKNIGAAVQNYLLDMTIKTKDILTSNNQVFVVDEKTFSYPGLGEDFLNKEKLNKYKLTEDQLDNSIMYANVNYVINNIEYHKILFGDPLQFAVKKNGVLDETKRIKSFLSPRRITFDSPELNTHLNQKYNMVNGVMLEKGDPGYHFHKPYTNTVTLFDVETAGSLSNIMAAYSKTNEADAASWVMDTTYREIKLKNGQWSDSAEAWHQWHMAYTRQNYPGYVYSKENAALEEHDIALVKTKEPYHKIEILKPIVSGNKYGKTQFDLNLDKLSQMPMYFKMIQGTSMEKQYIKNNNEGIGYTIMESGRKVGAETNHSLYNGDGTFNETPYESVIQVAWKAYGIQVETASEGPKTQTRGSQLTKGSSMDLYNNGVASSPAAEKAYVRNKAVLDKMHLNAYKTLLHKMGVVDIGNGFEMPNGVAISNTLMHEMSRREVSDNTKDSIRLNDEGEFPIPFEASPSYIQIRNILYSMIDKALISPKMNGGAHVQIPATMFEQGTKGRGLTIKKDGVWTKISRTEYNSYDEATKNKVMLTDDTLKFYTKEDPYCEILVPHWFKATLGKAQKNMTDEELLNYLNNSVDGKKLLQGIAFRIPTQALSSVETYRVKGFLPQYMGSTVVVPSEITTKAGSDFDIDKLNMYMKSAYLDRSGDVRLVKYYDTEEDCNNFFGKVFDDTLAAKVMKKADLLEAIDIAMYNLPDPNGLLSQYGKMIESFSIDYARTEEEAGEIDRLGLLDANLRYDGLVNETGIQMNKLTDENIQSVYRSVYQSKMYKASLENEYYESLEELITLPENFDALITPIGDADLESLSETMDKLRGYNESGIRNKILDRNYLTSMRNSFLTAKRWVGIAAVNITGLSVKQKSQIYIDPARIAKLDFADKKYLGDGIIALPHNTVTIDNSEYVSLSGVTVKDSKERISDRLSGYATAFVDVAKGDYITKIIQSDLAVGVFMFLENIGTGDRAAYFCNQPIITEYLNYLDSITAKTLFNEKHLATIRDRFVHTDHDRIVGIDISQESLEKNMKDFYTTKAGLSDRQNAEQQNILDEFLKYAKMADFNFQFTQAINYDTSSFRSAETMTLKQWKTQEAETSNIISSAYKALNSTFIGEQAALTSSLVDAMGAVLKLDSVEFKAVTNTVLRSYANNQFLSGDTLEKIAVEIKAAFIDYAVQTNTGLNNIIEEALVNEHTAVVYQLAQAKVDYSELQILQDLDIVTGNREGGAKSIKLTANTKAAYDENLYTGMMRELRDHDANTNKLYTNLVKLSILQGTYGSAISIRNIIPLEDYAAIVGPIIAELQVTPELKAFTQGMFQRNNFRNQDIMPRITNLRMEAVEDLTTGEVSYIYPSKFPVIPVLGSTPYNRGLLVLSEKYNSFEIKNDFLAMPRMQEDQSSGMMIDMKTGSILQPIDFATMKQKGDQSLYDVYGYQKVKMKNGLPLIHTKIVNKEIQRFQVYKLVNLYGDGDRATENYTDFRPSVIDNGGVKTEEVDNARIIEHYSGVVEENDVTLPATTETQAKPTTEISKVFERMWEEHAYEILDKFPTMDREQYDTMSAEEKDNLLGCL
jgi:hypothetical protein